MTRSSWRGSDKADRYLQESAWCRSTGCEGWEAEECRYIRHDYIIRGYASYAGYDEDVRYEPGTDGTEGQTLVLNANNALVQYVLNNPEGEHVNMFCQQIYDLALLSHCPLSAESHDKICCKKQRNSETPCKIKCMYNFSNWMNFYTVQWWITNLIMW